MSIQTTLDQFDKTVGIMVYSSLESFSEKKAKHYASNFFRLDKRILTVLHKLPDSTILFVSKREIAESIRRYAFECY